MTKKVLVIHEYFEPAYKAGGPIRSLANMVQALKPRYSFDVICSAHDLDGEPLPSTIHTNQWNSWHHAARVYYAKGSLLTLIRLIRRSDAEVIFINGVFSLRFTLIPLFAHRARKCVVSARGMLKPMALRQRRRKKMIFLFFFRLFGLHRNVLFHVTDKQEGEELSELFHHQVQWLACGNFPRLLPFHPPLPKVRGRLVLCTVSLVNRIKNHAAVLRALRHVSGEVQYSFYGPVHDKECMKELVALMGQVPTNIKVHYGGEVLPQNVEAVLAACHVFILPSKTENFGHSIFEALAAGRPVITSSNTPWKALTQQQAGYTIDLESTSLSDVLQTYIDMGEEEYQQQCQAARLVAEQSYDSRLLEQQYTQLFSLA